MENIEKINMESADQQEFITLKEQYEIIANQTPAWFHKTIGIVLIISTSVSICTNGSVLYIFFVKDRKLLERRTNVYIVAVCSISMITSLFGVPMVIVSCFNQVWYFGDIGCKYYAFLMTFGGLSTMFILSMVFIDRFIFIMTCNMSNRLMDAFGVISVCCSFGISLGFALRPLLGWNQYTYEGVGTSCAIDLIGEEYNGRSYVLTLLITFFLIPVSIMFLISGALYFKILSLSKIYKSPGRRRSKAEQMHRKIRLEQNLLRMFGVITGLFLLCWSPFAILLFWIMANEEANVNSMVAVIPSVFCKVWGVFTPFVYLSQHKNIDKQFVSIYYEWNATDTDHAINDANMREDGVNRDHPIELALFNIVPISAKPNIGRSPKDADYPDDNMEISTTKSKASSTESKKHVIPIELTESKIETNVPERIFSLEVKEARTSLDNDNSGICVNDLYESKRGRRKKISSTRRLSVIELNEPGVSS